jgi:hypothetical protein
MPINARLPFFGRRLFRLRNILLIVMLMVLALPLGGLYFFRIYENELVQQTERELIAQSAALSASYRQLLRNLAPVGRPYGRKLSGAASVEVPSDSHDEGYYRPILPGLSLIDPIQPPRPDAKPSLASADALSVRAGQLLLPVMRDTQQVSLAGMRLLDMNGTVIAGREEIGLSLAHLPEVQKALQGHYAGVIRQRLSDQPPPPLYSVSRGTHIRVFVAFPVIEKGYLQGVFYLSRTPQNILKHLYGVKERVIIATLSLLTLVVLVVAFVFLHFAPDPRADTTNGADQRRGTEKLRTAPLSDHVRNSAAFGELCRCVEGPGGAQRLYQALRQPCLP